MDKNFFLGNFNGFLEEFSDRDHAVSQLFSQWKELRETLNIFYQKRDQKAALPEMRKGISIFIQLLFLINDLPVNKYALEQIEQVPVKPFNLVERLDFIQGRPSLFHSYRQLSELMAELEKLYAKKKIRQTKSV